MTENKKYELWIITWFKDIISDTKENLIKAKGKFESTEPNKFRHKAAKWMSSVTGLFFAAWGVMFIILSYLPKLSALGSFGMWLIAIGVVFIIARNVIIPLAIVAIGYILLLLDVVDIFDLLFNSGIIWKIIILVPYFAWEYFSIVRKRKKGEIPQQ